MQNCLLSGNKYEQSICLSVCGSAICSTKEQQFSQHSQLFYFAFPLVNFRFYCIFFGCGKCWCTLHSCCNNSWQWQVAYENVCSRVCKCLFDKLLKFHCLRWVNKSRKWLRNNSPSLGTESFCLPTLHIYLRACQSLLSITRIIMLNSILLQHSDSISTYFVHALRVLKCHYKENS